MLHRMQTPLAFFLELLAIALLVVGRGGPGHGPAADRPAAGGRAGRFLFDAGRGRRPAVAAAAAEAALAEELRRDNYLVRLILAGAEPRLLGQPQQTPEEAQPLLAAWTCQSPWADLRRAVGLAGEVGGPNARILVLTDQAPPMGIRGGAVQWWAFGAKLPNMAFTAAVRTASGENQRALLEVTNLSDAPGRTVLDHRGREPGGAQENPRASWRPGRRGSSSSICPPARRRCRRRSRTMPWPSTTRSGSCPTPPCWSACGWTWPTAALRTAVARAVRATGMALEVALRPDLVVCDRAGCRRRATPGDWRSPAAVRRGLRRAVRARSYPPAG